MTAVIYMRLAWKGSQFSRTVPWYTWTRGETEAAIVPRLEISKHNPSTAWALRERVVRLLSAAMHEINKTSFFIDGTDHSVWTRVSQWSRLFDLHEFIAADSSKSDSRSSWIAGKREKLTQSTCLCPTLIISPKCICITALWYITFQPLSFLYVIPIPPPLTSSLIQVLHHLLVIASSCRATASKRMWLRCISASSCSHRRGSCLCIPQSGYICPLICAFKAHFLCQIANVSQCKSQFSPGCWQNTILVICNRPNPDITGYIQP